MGNQHVKLTIDENGNVTGVGSTEVFETCIICGELTDVLVNSHIDNRYGYVEGAGQCCRKCYDKTNERSDDYVTNVMRRRTTLVTIPAEEIYNTPNDFDLGVKVRQLYWNIFGK
jgi:RecJ-like exonuclease